MNNVDILTPLGFVGRGDEVFTDEDACRANVGCETATTGGNDGRVLETRAAREAGRARGARDLRARFMRVLGVLTSSPRHRSVIKSLLHVDRFLQIRSGSKSTVKRIRDREESS